MNRRGFLSFLGLAPVALPAAMAMPAGSATETFVGIDGGGIAGVATSTLRVKLELDTSEVASVWRDWRGKGWLRSDNKCADCEPEPLALPALVRRDEISEAHT